MNETRNKVELPSGYCEDLGLCTECRLTWYLAFGTHYIEASSFVDKGFIVMQNSKWTLNANPLDS